MNYCRKCGKELQAGVYFCPKCGSPVPQMQSINATSEGLNNSEVLNNDEGRLMAVVAYLLFFIPLIVGAHRKSEFVKFHTNQGLVLFLTATVLSVLSFSPLSYILPSMFSLIYFFLSGICSLLLLFLLIFGIINAITEKRRALPLIGKIVIIK